MQVPKFRCTDKLYVQLTYFHCTAFKIKNQPFASNVLTAASMPAVCGCKKPAAFQRRDHKAGSFCPAERVPVTRPPRPRRGTLPPASMPVVCHRRDHITDAFCPTERVPARAPRDFAAARCRPLSVRGRRRFRDGCTRKYRARRPTCTNGIPPRCGSSSSPPASSSVCRQCGG